MALPEGFEEFAGEEDELDENGEPKARKEVIYIAGRVYKEEVNPKIKSPMLTLNGYMSATTK